MKTTSIGINKWAGSQELIKAWQRGTGDQKLIGWIRGDGLRAVETNGDPIFEGEQGFEDAWIEHHYDNT